MIEAVHRTRGGTMNAYIDTLTALIVYDERLHRKREPIILGHPKGSDHRRQVDEGNGRSKSGIACNLQSLARAVAGFLM
jgi:hypothetical protein